MSQGTQEETREDPGDPTEDLDNPMENAVSENVRERRIRTLTEKGQDQYKTSVLNYIQRLVQLRQDADSEILNHATREKHSTSSLNLTRYVLTELARKYSEHASKFLEFLSETNTLDSRNEYESQKVITSSVLGKIENVIREIDQRFQKDETSSRHSFAGSRSSNSISSSKTSSSSRSSILLKQRAKAEAAKARLEFAGREMELKKSEVQLEEEAMKAKAEILRKQSEVKLDLELLARQRDLATAEAELQAVRQELEEEGLLSLDNKSIVDRREFTNKYVMEQNPLAGEKEVNLGTEHELNPLAPPFVAQSVPIVAQQLPLSEVRQPRNNDNNMLVANELTKFLLKKDLLLSRFTTFNDQPESFPVWKSSFLNITRGLGVNAQEELDLLVKWLGPESSKHALSLRNANASNPEKGLKRVWERLEERFGLPEMVDSTLKRKLANFPRLTNKDYKKLYELSDLLSEIECVKEDPKYMALLSYFDTSTGINPVVAKLPYNLQSKWMDRATRYKKSHNVPFPPFTFFVGFVREMSSLFNDPGFVFDTKPHRDDGRKSQQPTLGFLSKPLVTAKKTDIGQVIDEKHDQKLSVCPLHKLKHSLNQCKTFRRKSLKDRKQFLKENKLCFKCCDSDTHGFKDCKLFNNCSECGSPRHPTAMHVDKQDPSRPEQGSVASSVHGGEEHQSVISSCTRICNERFGGRSCGKIVLVKVYRTENPDNFTRLYAMLDDQSNRTLGRSELFDNMNVSSAETQQYTLSSCAGRVEMNGRRAKGLTIESLDGNTKLSLPTVIECNEIPNVRDEIPSPDVTWFHEHLKEVPIPAVDPDAQILLLIGRDLIEAHHVFEQRTGPKNSPFAQRVGLGWVVIGDVCLGNTHKPDEFVNVNKTCILPNGRPTVFQECINKLSVNDREFSLDGSSNIGASVFDRTQLDDTLGLSIEDDKFVKLMDREFRKEENGHWSAPLPFRSLRPRLPNNKYQALRRAKLLESTLRRDPVKKDHFVTFMRSMLDRGHAEEAPPLENNEESWYLPIFGVYHPKKKDQIRVVFDSSAKHDGISLNNVLMSGPDLTNNLVGVLLRFRKEPVAIIADIQQMFYGFYVSDKHRNFLRFFWFKDNDIDNDLIEYRMCVHVFGNSPSPAIASYGLRRCVQGTGNNLDQDVKEFVERNFYVDDGLGSFATTSEAIDVVKRTQQALSEMGGLRLHKIASNKDDVMNGFPSDDLAKELKDLDLYKDDLPLQRSLGLCWDLKSDSFTYKISDEEKPVTRRGILSTVNSLFDPLGFISPVVIQGRVLMRELVSETTDWDLPLSDASQKSWMDWKDSLKCLEDLNIARCFVPTSLSNSKRRELHIFSDASEKAIAGVAYLRTVDITGQVQVGFVFGKSKVAPKHGHTIPRLELCAAVLGVEIAQLISEQLDVSLDNIVYYTDSKVVLGYLRNEVRRFYIYVSNRVSKIRKFSTPQQWNYVASELNPADHGTRHVFSHQLKDSTWLLGPKFLHSENLSEQDCSTEKLYPLINPEEDKELRPEVEVLKTNVTVSHSFGSHRFQKFSKWKDLVNAISRLQHIASTFKLKHDSRLQCQGWHLCSIYKDVESSRKAEQCIIKQVQGEYYHKEIQSLKDGKPLPRNSTVLSLSPFLDKNGILRVGGRLSASNLPIHEKNPILIPGHNHIATLLTRHFHEVVKHQGRHFTEGAVRSSGFWITGGKRLVSSIIFKCVRCKRLRGSFEKQKMADLPLDRITPSPPFTFVGVDVFGPWTVVTRRTRGGSADSKRWAVLFTCLCSRAVHIELIEEMSSSSFINALRKFLAIRGKVQEFRSDRGSNFIGSTDELQINAVNVEDGPIKGFLYDSGTIWRFNPPHSSHFGGVWERMIGVSRRILDSMLLEVKYKNLTHEVLSTFMAEVSAIINSRPIVSVSTDAEAPFILTPAILLTQKTNNETNCFQHLSVKDMYKSQWKFVQVLAENFWLRWRREYLPMIQSRQKWQCSIPNVKEGDVVLLRDRDAIRNNWPVGIILRVFPSNDHLVRKVEVRVVKEGKPFVYIRPVSEIVKLISD